MLSIIPFLAVISVVVLLIWLNYSMISAVDKHSERPAFGMIHVFLSVILAAFVMIYIDISLLGPVQDNNNVAMNQLQAKYSEKLEKAKAEEPKVVITATPTPEPEQQPYYRLNLIYQNVDRFEITYRDGSKFNQQLPEHVTTIQLVRWY